MGKARLHEPQSGMRARQCVAAILLCMTLYATYLGSAENSAAHGARPTARPEAHRTAVTVASSRQTPMDERAACAEPAPERRRVRDKRGERSDGISQTGQMESHRPVLLLARMLAREWQSAWMAGGRQPPIAGPA